MLSIFVEASCNRYERDECVDCHVFEPLTPHFNAADWHLTCEQAQTMADNIRQVEVLHTLAQHEINLTGGEASQNPYIVEIVEIFKTVTPNVCLHTNLEIKSSDSERWKRLEAIVRLGGRIDITLYPTAWEAYQRPLLQALLAIQHRLLVNVVFFNLPDLNQQLGLLMDFFQEESRFGPVVELLQGYRSKVAALIEEYPDCNEATYLKRMDQTGSFAKAGDFVFGINLLPAFNIDAQGRRALTSLPFPKDPYLLVCPAVRGSIEIMTVQQNGEMTPCCDVGNLKCQPKFGNLLTDTPEQIQSRFEASRQVMQAGVRKNQDNLDQGRAGTWVEEGVPPYCV